ncbi:MAG: 2-C-methyl-D-erythritol 4-phosphate cytidylyltransferase [Pseudomonadota bacterium]
MSSNFPVWAIVPAAGIGARMEADHPKQYLSFQGKTVIEHCLDRLLSHPQISGAVVVLNETDSTWDTLDYQSDKTLFFATGGEHRMHSVYQGLCTLQYRFGNDVIALIHDAARPLVTHMELEKVISAARNNEAGAVLAAPVADTLKLQGESMEIVSTVSRDRLWRALTPQVFHLQPLLGALKNAIDQGQGATDDASAIERMGYAPEIVAGSPLNVKLTAPGDLEFMEMIWLHQRNQNDNK